MSFDIVTIRGVDTYDDWLYPTLSDDGAAFPIATDGTDGPNITVLRASKLEVHTSTPAGLDLILSRSDIKIDVLITDCRLAFYCERYDKGGGWVGTPGAMLISNAVSKTRAAIRSRGKVLVGQVRYPWVAATAAQSKTSWLTEEMLRLMVRERENGGIRTLLLDLTLRKAHDAASAAQEVAVRAARHRLARGESMEPAEREK